MRVFLVGGTGAFGAHLLPLLREHGHTVLGLSRSDAGAALMTRHGAETLNGDIFDPAVLLEGCRGCDAVIDLSTADPRLPRPGGRDWSINHRIRSEGVRNLTVAALKGGVGRYVHAGLGLVYGDHGSTWVDESADLRTPPLLHSAREGEESVLALRRTHGINATVLRLGEIYG
ncbi:MAG: NAD(P)-dependent oxidoreductase, partial [Chloroflexi bacterium]|nr:NAD(P)-dependent oxidoreductase [Chloroflexota bacterium]